MSTTKATIPTTGQRTVEEAGYRRVRRIVTGENSSGRSVVLADGPTPNGVVFAHGPQCAQVVWTTEPGAASFEEGYDPAPADRKFKIGPVAGGTLLRIVDFPPDELYDIEKSKEFLAEIGGDDARDRNNPRHFFFHKTDTIDYAIILEGEIYALLDEDDVLMKAGDVMIQRATNHSWSNKSGKTCRIAFVLVDTHEAK